MTNSGWYTGDGSDNPYTPQPQGRAPGAARPNAFSPQPDSVAWPVTRNDMQPRAAGKQTPGPPNSSGSWQAVQEDVNKPSARNPNASAQQPESSAVSRSWPETRSDAEKQAKYSSEGKKPLAGGEKAQTRQVKDKYDRGDGRKTRRDVEPERNRGHESHKYWRGE